MQTRCPHCQTRFRVTTEQLKLRQGQVRCGACHAVFDALDSLSDESLVILASPEPEPHKPLSALPESQPLPDGTVAAIEAAANERVEPAPEPEIEIVIGSEPEMQTTSESEPVPEPEPEPVIEPELEPLAEPVAQDQSEPIHAAAATTPEATDTPALPEAWTTVPTVKPARRWPWVVGSLVLLLTAALQLAYQFRVELAVVAPALRPMLIAGCELLGCDLPRPRKPDQIDFETSDLVPQGTGLLLTTTLRNRAPFEQEYPHLELTLTDTQDVALVRKVIAPAEYLPAGQAPEAGFAARGTVDIKLALALDNVPAVGYRLYFFFP